MSSDIIARVNAFNDKADELAKKGHLLRAAENFGRAAEAAGALGADNLVTVHMRLQQGNMLGAQITLSSDYFPPVLHCREYIALLSGAVEALERRRTAGTPAGTLLEGTCSAVEEAWQTGQVLQGCCGSRERVTAAEASSWAALFGYEEFI